LTVRTPHLAHTQTVGDLTARSQVRIENGLTGEEVIPRQRQFGANLLPTAPPRARWRILAAQFSSALILILLGASILSAAIGNTKDAIVIACVVVINALFGYYQEYRAEQSLAALKGMLPMTGPRQASGRHRGNPG
jgi:Ca2+-transporting ATPase